MLRKSSAIVLEDDNPEGHGAIAGMSLDIPVIIGAKNATNILKSGAVVTGGRRKGHGERQLMHVLTIDGRQFSDGKAVHRMLKKLLCLPDYYGGNADALYDALDERSERIDLRLLSLGGEDTAKTLRKVARVVQDLGGTVIWADEKQERN